MTTAMSATAATSGFIIVLALSVVQGQHDYKVNYISSKICALKGSLVEIRCTFRYPARLNDLETTVERTFWFTKLLDGKPLDLRADSEYLNRLQYRCSKNSCTLSITDLRQSDSGLYYFRFITNQPRGQFTGTPGVNLSVTGLHVTKGKYWSDLKCQSSCSLPDHPSHIFYQNGQIRTSGYIDSTASYSCAVKGQEDLPSPSVCVYDNPCNTVTYTDRNICAFKGSSVNISCTYKSRQQIKSKFWFSSQRGRRWKDPSQPEDLSKDSQYTGRVQVTDTEGRLSTLTITDLRETDSAQYHFKFKTPGFEWISTLPGTTLTVTDPKFEVQVIWSTIGPKLVCHSSCLPPGHSFVWYMNQQKVLKETSPYFSGHVDPSDNYSCAMSGHERYPSLPVYAPKVPTVLMSQSGDVVKDSSVSLTCNSDANPPSKHTWYKNNQKLLSEAPQLLFISIQSSDSGQYSCLADNELGSTMSKHVAVDVKYGPKTSNISVSPSGDIVEGRSVTLTCSSDANPAANYTWYKENRTLLHSPEGVYIFPSIRSEDRGSYHCKSGNNYGQINSASLFLDVEYAPKPPSVSVSPSGDIVEGRSVTLTCSSDADPAANYTWYKENEDSPRASGQNFTITDYKDEHGGNYYCEAWNSRGRHNSTLLHVTMAAGGWKLAATGTTTAVLLVVILLAVFLWIRRNKSFSQRRACAEPAVSKAQINSGPVYDTPPAAVRRQPAGEEDELHYASVSFSQSHPDALYSNIKSALPTRPRQDGEQDSAEYTEVKPDGASSASRTKQEPAEDSFALYSVVNKKYKNDT